MRATKHRSSRLRLAPLFLLAVVSFSVQGCDADGVGSVSPTPLPLPISVGGFSLSAAPDSIVVLQGAHSEMAIAIERTSNFAGSVELSVMGLPAGMTATISPASTALTSATLRVSAQTEMPVGPVALTILGSSPGMPTQSTTANITVGAPQGGAGNVSLDFSSCASSQPLWVATQDGNGAWTQGLGRSARYQFAVNSDRGGYAFITQEDAYSALTIRFLTAAELTRAVIYPCGGGGEPRVQRQGDVAGLTSSEVAYVGLGDTYTDLEQGYVTGSFTMFGIRSGLRDLIAYRSDPTTLFTTRERVIIRRDQDVQSIPSLGTLDFDGVDTFTPNVATATVTGAGAGQARQFMSYHAGTQCAYYTLYGDDSPGPSFRIRGVPSAQQRVSEFHALTAYVGEPYRSVTESFHSIADRVIALPPPLPPPTITRLAGAHARVQAQLQLPEEYRTQVLLLLSLARATVYLSASYGWLGGATPTLTLPDFSRVSGWSSAYLPDDGVRHHWFVSADGANSVGAVSGACAEHARFYTSFSHGEW